MADLQFRQVDFDVVGQVVRQATDIHLGKDVAHHTATGFYSRCNFGVHEVQRHLHVDLLVLRHALKVHVQDFQTPGMHLIVAQEHLLLLTFQA